MALPFWAGREHEWYRILPNESMMDWKGIKQAYGFATYGRKAFTRVSA